MSKIFNVLMELDEIQTFYHFNCCRPVCILYFGRL